MKCFIRKKEGKTEDEAILCLAFCEQDPIVLGNLTLVAIAMSGSRGYVLVSGHKLFGQ